MIEQDKKQQKLHSILRMGSRVSILAAHFCYSRENCRPCLDVPGHPYSRSLLLESSFLPRIRQFQTPFNVIVQEQVQRSFDLSDLDLYSTECEILNPLTESESQIFCLCLSILEFPMLRIEYS
jgi:hypothetical protein